ncbi:hypothetical protein PVK06_030092 [Gossypium arboreum]|uniref:RNase H type-1 domain-containing protein n=1 Tax=Gossypium arboreum TaxID=29729 RepID=A0ABR0NMD2_GOSAR|nr:hypothetical protein PVK06_030092 [Gossypium arboreum]
MEVSIFENFGSDKSIVEELIPRKVRFRDKDEDSNDGMKVDPPSAHPTSWKDMLVGPIVDDAFKGPKEKEAIVFMDGDIQNTVVNGVPSITFSYRIHQILFQALGNPSQGLRRKQKRLFVSPWDSGPESPRNQTRLFVSHRSSHPPSEPRLQASNQAVPWTLAFDPAQAYPSVVMEWIRFPALPSYLYNRMVITEIEKLVGKKVEYESLSTIWFHCGRYGHVENNCSFKIAESVAEEDNMSPEMILENSNLVREEPEKKDENYEPWMIVERKSRRKVRNNGQKDAGFHGKGIDTGLDIVDVAARDHLEQNGPAGVVKSSLAATGNCRQIFTAGATTSAFSVENPSKDAGESSPLHLPTAILNGGNESEINRSSAPPTNNSLVLAQEGFIGLGKKGKTKGTKIFTKQNKFSHGSNTRFKNSGSQRVSLKKSMEQLAVNIAALSHKNLDSGGLTRTDNNLGGVSSCWARQYESNFHGSKRIDPISTSVNNSDDTWILLSTDGAVDRNSGILILLNKGYRRALIQTDNLEVAQTLRDLSLEDSGIAVLRRTQCIMKAEGTWKIKHISKTQNLVADRLAKLSLSWKTSLQILNEAREELSVLLQEEKDNGWFM